MKVIFENQVYKNTRYETGKKRGTIQSDSDMMFSTLYSTDVPIETATEVFEAEVKNFLDASGIKTQDLSLIRNGMTKLWQFQIVTFDEPPLFLTFDKLLDTPATAETAEQEQSDFNQLCNSIFDFLDSVGGFEDYTTIKRDLIETKDTVSFTLVDEATEDVLPMTLRKVDGSFDFLEE